MNQFEIDSDSTSFEPVNLNVARNVTPSFQNNNTNQTNTTTPSTYTSTTTNATANVPHAGANPTSWFQKLTTCFTISTLEKHFNIDTIDFRNRIISSVMDANKPNHFREQVLYANHGLKQPDLYGPVWITMTLVFLFAVTGNTSKFLLVHDDALQDVVEYDIGHLTKAFFILVFYTFVLPLAMFVMLSCIQVNNVGWVELISIYGYSLVSFIPASVVLCVVPWWDWLEWLILLLATVVSLLLVLRNVMVSVMTSTSSPSSRWGGSVATCIVACHVVFFLVVKFVFYRHRGGSKSIRGGSSGGSSGGNDDVIGDDGMTL